MRGTVTSDAVLEEMRGIIAKSTLRKVAQQRGMSPAYLSDVMLERRGISAEVAKKFGFERIVKTEVVFKKSGGGK